MGHIVTSQVWSPRSYREGSYLMHIPSRQSMKCSLWLRMPCAASHGIARWVEGVLNHKLFKVCKYVSWAIPQPVGML